MSSADIASGAGPLFVLAVGLLGVLLGVLTELLIARSLPRLGGLPSIRSRITTAVLTAALCAALALRIGMDWSLPAFLVLGVLAVQLARIDLAHHLLPNALVLALLIGGLALFAMSSSFSAAWSSLLRAVAGAVILFFIYLVLALISPSGIGMGDVKLAAPVGLFLGYLGWSHLFYGGALGFVLGGIASVVLISLKRAGKSSEVAFGPAMLAATLGVVLSAA
ncbi:leader peptidase (prepilin peptidase)/N-methyltransferase [Arthrobacter pascens]|uniref:prepilin peptidase n=1 Tax=Arthrobacter pascens TaxID=1677 RepID=UPI00278D010C|nr:prepilin peptidase [Arthrobacter pascens]MDQ0677558.1 leader peptidase (prepilin peptidase)/N-methyltransferase [Arthrobacter pascens]